MSINIISGIYMITSPSGKKYIGQALDIYKRWREYKDLRNCKGQLVLYRSFLKYGVLNHKFKIVIECPELELHALEVHYIRLYDTYENGINCTLGGDGIKGYKMSDESKQKSSKSHTGKKHSDMSKKKESNSQKIAWVKRKQEGRDKHTDETKRKIKSSNTGKKHSAERREKLSARLRGNKYALGHKWSDASRAKRSLIKRIPLSDTQKENMRIAAKLAWAKRKIEGTNKSSEETKIKNGAAQKLAWERRRKEGRDKSSPESIEKRAKKLRGMKRTHETRKIMSQRAIARWAKIKKASVLMDINGNNDTVSNQ